MVASARNGSSLHDAADRILGPGVRPRHRDVAALGEPGRGRLGSPARSVEHGSLSAANVLETRLAITAAMLAVAAVIAMVLNRRRPAPPTRDTYPTPRQLDRNDFSRPTAPWLVVLFTARTCDSCADMLAKARSLESDEVTVCEVEVGERGDLHERYGIDAVPILLVADLQGVVQAAYVGPVTPGELSARVSELLSDGS